MSKLKTLGLAGVLASVGALNSSCVPLAILAAADHHAHVTNRARNSQNTTSFYQPSVVQASLQTPIVKDPSGATYTILPNGYCVSDWNMDGVISQDEYDNQIRLGKENFPHLFKEN